MNGTSDFYMGLLSGTSVDCIDAALWSFPAENQIQLIDSLQAEIPCEVKKQILTLSQQGTCSLKELGELDKRLGLLFTDAVLQLIEKAKVSCKSVKAIGSHGQTVWHQPDTLLPFTMQIGDPSTIAQLTQIDTVADFRRADMALGGQGAPLVPAFHDWLFHADYIDRVVVNIGGIANISVLPKDKKLPVIGYDTGPGNALLDAWTEKHRGMPYDKDGAFASLGTPDATLLKALCSEPYFKKAFPKSTGKDLFRPQWLKSYLNGFEVSPENVQATLVELTSITISDAIKRHFKAGEVYVCGGGAHNLTLMTSLSKALGGSFALRSTSALGVPPDWVESACFAWLAKQRIERKPIRLSAVTGSSRDTLLGGLFTALTTDGLVA